MRNQAFLRAVQTRYLPQIQQQIHQNYPVTISSSSYPFYDYSCPQTEDFHHSQAKIRGIFGGNRASKSETGGYEIVCLSRKYPGELFWVCGSTLDKVKICHKKIMKYLHPSEIQKIIWANEGLGWPRLIKKNDGTIIEYKTYKSGVEAFAGESCKGIWFDEDPAVSRLSGEEIFIEALQRTVDCSGYFFITATPILGKNWMYHRIHKLRKINPNIDSWIISLLDNKFVAQKDKDLIRSLMTENEIKRRFYGQFTTLQGAVFPEFKDTIHIIEPFKIPAEWRHAISIDFGFHHHFAVVFGALAPDNTLFIYAGYKEKERLLEEHYHDILKIAENMDLYDNPGKYMPFYRWESAIADHDAQQRAELDNLGLITIPAIKDVMPGVDIVNRLFKHKKLMIFNTIPELQNELEQLIFKPISDRTDDKEVILKKNDHLCDCLRYLCQYFFGESEFALGSTEIITESRIV